MVCGNTRPRMWSWLLVDWQKAQVQKFFQIHRIIGDICWHKVARTFISRVVKGKLELFASSQSQEYTWQRLSALLRIWRSTGVCESLSFYSVIFSRFYCLFLWFCGFEDWIHSTLWRINQEKNAVAADKKRNRRPKAKQKEKWRRVKDVFTENIRWKNNCTVKCFWVPTMTDHAEFHFDSMIDEIHHDTFYALLNLFRLQTWERERSPTHITKLKSKILHLSDKANEEPLHEFVHEFHCRTITEFVTALNWNK